MAYIYKHTRVDKNEVFYIGIGSDTDYTRAYSTISRNTHWNNIINVTDYIVDIIEDGLTWEDACIGEIRWIEHYGRRDLNEGTLVNMTNGGDGSFGLVHTDKTKSKISKANSGVNHPLFGKKRDETFSKKMSNWIRTDEIKKKISKTRCDKFQSGELKPSKYERTNEIREKNRLALIGKPKTDEHRRNISLGKQNISDDTKLKISLSMVGKNAGENNPSAIKCFDLETNTLYNCMKDASVATGLSYYQMNSKKGKMRFTKIK